MPRAIKGRVETPRRQLRRELAAGGWRVGERVPLLGLSPWSPWSLEAPLEALSEAPLEAWSEAPLEAPLEALSEAPLESRVESGAGGVQSSAGGDIEGRPASHQEGGR